MELKALTGYASAYGTLSAGDTTEPFDFPEAEKKRMLETFPGWFEVVEGVKAKKEEPLVANDKDGLVEIPEAKVTLRKK